MTNSILLFLACMFCLFVGFVVGKLISKLTSEKEQIGLNEKNNNLTTLLSEAKENSDALRNSKERELGELREKNNQLSIAITKTNAALENSQKMLRENKKEVEQLQEKFSKEFENLANKILDEKSQKFKQQNKESIHEILNPLKEKIQTFEKKVEETNKESIGRHSALNEQIKGLKDLNLKMSQEAINLTKALKGDSKTQGNWGEMILERVLEKSGLEKGREYDLEKSFAVADENKTRLRPDVIINLPDHRKMIVDSKVSLTAYEQFVNSENELEKVKHLKEHVNSLKRHIDQLSAKKYEDLYQIESPDFVLLFIPIEPAFAMALEEDGQLYNKAFEKNIVIVTPATLLATLRTIDSMWQNEKQQKNAIEISRQAGALYDKFVGLYQDLIKIGRKMDDAKKDYSSAMNKLHDGKGNLITSVEKIKKLGAKAKKSLPESSIERAIEE